MAKKNYYVVKAGRKTGIFKTWAECSESIRGYSGAIYKGFETLAEANDYMENNAERPIDIKIDEAQEELDFPVAYVDGSFDAKRLIYSYGVVIIRPDGEIIEYAGTGKNAEAAAERNIAGELLGAMTAIKWAYANGYKKVLIKHDYEGIARWARGEWAAKKYCSSSYIKFIAKYKKEMVILFEKVLAHSGIYYNELADKLAKNALQDTM